MTDSKQKLGVTGEKGIPRKGAGSKGTEEMNVSGCCNGTQATDLEYSPGWCEAIGKKKLKR
jgi:hypothetical protein